jgi:hypothetical protein
MQIRQEADGAWSVVAQTGEVLASGLTNAEAWRFFDRAEREPISRTEDVTDWLCRQREQ